MLPDRATLARLLAVPAIALAVYLLVFHRLAERGLWSSHEARAGLNASWYLRNPGWGPSFLPDGTPELQKPPLSYWLIAGTARLLGEEHPGPLAIRLPSAVAAIVCAGCLVFLGIRTGNPRRGIVAGMMLLTMTHFTWLARIARTDMPLAAAITAGCCCQVVIRREAGVARHWAAFGLALACAIGVMTKGPLAPVLLAAVGLGLSVFRARATWAETMRHAAWLVLPVVAGAFACLPWFLEADARTDGKFTEEFFWLHTWGRGMGGTRLREHPWWLYLVQGPFEALPWSLLLVPAIAWAVRRQGDATPVRRDALDGIVWLAAIIGVLTAARFKRMDYLIPAFPAAAWVVACWWEARQMSLALARRRWEGGALVAAMALVAAGWCFHIEWTLPADNRLRDLGTMARSINEQVPGDETPVFFQLEQHELAYWLNRPLRTRIDWPELASETDSKGAAWVVTARQRLAEGLFIEPGFAWKMLAERDPGRTLSLPDRADLVLVRLERRSPASPVVLASCPESPPSTR
ncbi:MAG: glycosyltransferase family 39 protein [Planctomycetes bacterium]|nr:glycosyltransferase family 39 protein [Planctomycetota bacterium]